MTAIELQNWIIEIMQPNFSNLINWKVIAIILFGGLLLYTPFTKFFKSWFPKLVSGFFGMLIISGGLIITAISGVSEIDGRVFSFDDEDFDYINLETGKVSMEGFSKSKDLKAWYSEFENYKNKLPLQNKKYETKAESDNIITITFKDDNNFMHELTLEKSQIQKSRDGSEYILFKVMPENIIHGYMKGDLFDVEVFN